MRLSHLHRYFLLVLIGLLKFSDAFLEVDKISCSAKRYGLPEGAYYVTAAALDESFILIKSAIADLEQPPPLPQRISGLLFALLGVDPTNAESQSAAVVRLKAIFQRTLDWMTAPDTNYKVHCLQWPASPLAPNKCRSWAAAYANTTGIYVCDKVWPTMKKNWITVRIDGLQDFVVHPDQYLGGGGSFSKTLVHEAFHAASGNEDGKVTILDQPSTDPISKKSSKAYGYKACFWLAQNKKANTQELQWLNADTFALIVYAMYFKKIDWSTGYARPLVDCSANPGKC